MGIQMASATLDKWAVCGNLSLTTNDCDDFWDYLTANYTTNITTTTICNLTEYSDRTETIRLIDDKLDDITNQTEKYYKSQMDFEVLKLNYSHQLEIAKLEKPSGMTEAEVNQMIANAVSSLKSSMSNQNIQIPAPKRDYTTYWIVAIIIIVIAVYFGKKYLEDQKKKLIHYEEPRPPLAEPRGSAEAKLNKKDGEEKINTSKVDRESA